MGIYISCIVHLRDESLHRAAKIVLIHIKSKENAKALTNKLLLKAAQQRRGPSRRAEQRRSAVDNNAWFALGGNRFGTSCLRRGVSRGRAGRKHLPCVRDNNHAKRQIRAASHHHFIACQAISFNSLEIQGELKPNTAA
ncbi:MAG: hypothetical protein GPOALKHO_000999 [Sodalis sp.]|nr:MAG: hypothetical protein GPOALKHO_000999 [Sodalis sp.]